MKRALFVLSVVLAAQAPAPNPAIQVPAAELEKIRTELQPLSAQLGALSKSPYFADVAIYEKAAQNLLKYQDEFYQDAYIKHAHDAIANGLARAQALAKGNAPWTKETGRVVRAYQSRIDDSVQPYKLTIPASYDGSKPVRLDVILHGRNGRLTEAWFIAPDAKPKPIPPGQDWIELEVNGRANNAYRWAGETDVFEAIDAVVKQYKIDPDRILLRGFSMGGAGAWHIGLHHPSRWAGVEAGAGFTETIRYANKPNLATHERANLHIYDAVDYTANITNTPFVGYGGEIDKQLQASLNIKEAMEAEQIRANAIFLVGPKTEHRWHPDSKAESETFLTKNLPRKTPETFRFVTWTPRYGRIWNWNVAALEHTYARAELTGSRSSVKTKNIAELELDAPAEVTIDGQTLKGKAFVKQMNRWEVRPAKALRLRKRAGLQGPIDDAFMDRFLVVADAPDVRLDTFAANFDKYFRGAIRRKTSKDLSKSDIAESHLVLWGTPANSKLIAKVVKDLPVRWTAAEIEIKGQKFDAKTHTLALIQPNPMNPSKYVVLNSGHTFGKADLVGTNALLYPRYGDWAVIETATGQVKAAGLFDEFWQ
ncbi:MAG TPA: prolyl oligopeptidase family serine peptidase [Bryobacteraceae bacterium]|nr:prolyl oligopeptidase family serine peptidase [Bryobacteraceae bacterium]